MRIIGGQAGGHILKVPKGFDVRPTPDLVRQAIFNSLGDTPSGANVLELFGGTGALALECLSRGAASAVCVELSSKHAAYIRANAEGAGLDRPLEIRVQDAFTALSQLRQQGISFDLILADPPYGEKNVGRRSNSFAQKLLDDPNLPHLLRDTGQFVLGHTKRDQLTIVSPWNERKAMKHGDTVIRFFTKAAQSPVQACQVASPS
jgi:16S rRNA (guanine966-N2)-methyltransferase